MRRIALILALIAAPIAGLAATAGADDTHTYEIEMYNAFGLVTGLRRADRRASTRARSPTSTSTPQKRAVVTVELSGDARHARQGHASAPPSRSR